MTFVKICGLTQPEHVKAARDADALGFIVNSPGSHRDLTPDAAHELVHLAGPFQTTVAVTSQRSPEVLVDIVRRVRPQALQVPFRAGQAAYDLLRETFPMLRILVSCRPEDAHLVPDTVDALVLDAAAVDGYGGAGILTDWNRSKAVRTSTKIPIILAGGLTPVNVGDAIRAVAPYGVDVSSGVETEKVKDAKKIREFIDSVGRADA